VIESDEPHTPHRILEEGMNKRGPRLRKYILLRGDNCAKLRGWFSGPAGPNTLDDIILKDL